MAKDILFEKAYRDIRNYVLANQQQGRIKINQNALAKHLGISRTPVTKALHILESEGLVDNIPNRGFYIHVPTIREMSELFVLRQGLEMIAVSHICQYGTEQDFQALEEPFAEFVGVPSIDHNRYAQADIRFHQLIFSLCDNRLIHKINDSLQIMNRIFSIGLLRPPKETLNEHMELVRAIRSRDETRAQELAHLHLESTRRYLDLLQRQMASLGLDPDSISAKDIAFRGSDGKA